MSIYHGWYQALVQYPLRYRIYFTVLLMLAIVCCWQLLIYRPLSYSMSRYVQKNNSMRLKIEELLKAQEQCKALSKSIHDHERELKEYQATVIGANEFMTYVVQQALVAQLYLLTCAAEPGNDYGWYRTQSLRIDLQGALSDIIQWLESISLKTRLLSTPSISISHADHNSVKCSASINHITVQSL